MTMLPRMDTDAMPLTPTPSDIQGERVSVKEKPVLVKSQSQ